MSVPTCVAGNDDGICVFYEQQVLEYTSEEELHALVVAAVYCLSGSARSLGCKPAWCAGVNDLKELRTASKDCTLSPGQKSRVHPLLGFACSMLLIGRQANFGFDTAL